MIAAILLVFGLTLVAQFILPWWSVALAAFLAGALRAETAGRAFAAGFAGVGGLWLVAAGYRHLISGGLLTERMGLMMGFPAPELLFIATAALGGLVGALGCSAGYYFRRVLKTL